MLSRAGDRSEHACVTITGAAEPRASGARVAVGREMGRSRAGWCHTCVILLLDLKPLDPNEQTDKRHVFAKQEIHDRAIVGEGVNVTRSPLAWSQRICPDRHQLPFLRLVAAQAPRDAASRGRRRVKASLRRWVARWMCLPMCLLRSLYKLYRRRQGNGIRLCREARRACLGLLYLPSCLVPKTAPSKGLSKSHGTTEPDQPECTIGTVRRSISRSGVISASALRVAPGLQAG